MNNLIMCPEIARMAGISKARMDVIRKDPQSRFPKPVKQIARMGRNLSYYDPQEAIAWINANNMSAFKIRNKAYSKIKQMAIEGQQQALDIAMAQRFIRGEFKCKHSI
jgi:predicted DNA-binding transcriptional regulator AlpA